MRECRTAPTAAGAASGACLSRCSAVSISSWRKTRSWRAASASSARRHAIPVGNLKIDAPPPPVDPGELARLKHALDGRPLLIAASTHDGEERVLAAAHRKLAAPPARLLHHHRAPPSRARHGDRRAHEELGHVVAQRSLGALPSTATDIYLADTIGELGTLFALAPIAFIGGSLVERGGQNPIEAMRHGAVVLTGPSWHNFRDAYQTLLRHNGAIEVRTADDLADAVARLPATMSRSHACAPAPTPALATLSGALARTVDALLRYLPASEELKLRLDEPPWWYGANRRSPRGCLQPARMALRLDRRAAPAHRHPLSRRLPVICVGNFTAGGTGKTPLSLLIAASSCSAARGRRS